MATFKLPPLQTESADSLFGPSASNLPEPYKDIPFQHFHKADRLGTIVDWSLNLTADAGNHSRSQGYNARARAQNARSALDGDAGGLYGYRNEEDEASFSLVGTTSTRTRPTGGSLGNIGRSTQYARAGGASRGGAQGSARGGYNQRGGGRYAASNARGAAGRRGGLTRSGWSREWANRDQRSRESSVQVGDKWSLLEEIEFSRLSKLRLDVETEDVETISQHGFLYEYDRTYDRVTTKSEKPLQRMERLHYNPTASDDPILQDLANRDRAKVFCTDSVLSMLMCSSRSVYPWDIVILREGGKIFMDKREEGPLDYLSVNENASDPPLEIHQIDTSTNQGAVINTPSALSQQATFLNENFKWQVVKESTETKLDLEKQNPFYDPEESEPLASCGYRYRRFDISITEDEEIDLIVRTEVDALLKGSLSATSAATPSGGAAPSSDEETFITINTLYEFDSRAQGSGGAPAWRAKLDSQRGAVVATEMKNNSLKLARWATMGILSGAGAMKIGYVSRANPRDETRHVILGTQWFKPRDLAGQMNVSLSNGWGIIRTIVDLCLKQKDGKYVLLKDPNKPVIRLYGVPAATFESGEEDELDHEAEEQGSDY